MLKHLHILVCVFFVYLLAFVSKNTINKHTYITMYVFPDIKRILV